MMPKLSFWGVNYSFSCFKCSFTLYKSSCFQWPPSQRCTWWDVGTIQSVFFRFQVVIDNSCLSVDLKIYLTFSPVPAFHRGGHLSVEARREELNRKSYVRICLHTTWTYASWVPWSITPSQSVNAKSVIAGRSHLAGGWSDAVPSPKTWTPLKSPGLR